MAFAGPGETVKLIVKNVEYNAIHRGDVICGSQYWTNVCTDFIANIKVLELPSSVLVCNGFTFILHIHTKMIPAEIVKVIKIFKDDEHDNMEEEHHKVNFIKS